MGARARVSEPRECDVFPLFPHTAGDNPTEHLVLASLHRAVATPRALRREITKHLRVRDGRQRMGPRTLASVRPSLIMIAIESKTSAESRRPSKS